MGERGEKGGASFEFGDSLERAGGERALGGEWGESEEVQGADLSAGRVGEKRVSGEEPVDPQNRNREKRTLRKSNLYKKIKRPHGPEFGESPKGEGNPVDNLPGPELRAEQILLDQEDQKQRPLQRVVGGETLLQPLSEQAVPQQTQLERRKCETPEEHEQTEEEPEGHLVFDDNGAQEPVDVSSLKVKELLDKELGGAAVQVPENLQNLPGPNAVRSQRASPNPGGT